MPIRRSNMIRWPVSCIVQVWTYSAANEATSSARYSAREAIEAVQAGRWRYSDRSPP